MIVQGPEAPRHEPSRPERRQRPSKPENKGKGKPNDRKPAAHKPAARKPERRHRPSKPESKGKRTAGRGEVELIWFDDVEFAPLAKSGHIH